MKLDDICVKCNVYLVGEVEFPKLNLKDFLLNFFFWTWIGLTCFNKSWLFVYIIHLLDSHWKIKKHSHFSLKQCFITLHAWEIARKIGTVLGCLITLHMSEKSLSHTVFHTLPLLYKTHCVLRGPCSTSLQVSRFHIDWQCQVRGYVFTWASGSSGLAQPSCGDICVFMYVSVIRWTQTCKKLTAI